MTRPLLVFAVMTSVLTGCGARRPARAAGDAPIAHLFGAPAGVGGGCRRGFARTSGVERLCFRSCESDDDCPGGSVCRELFASDEQRLCYAR